MFGSTVSAHGSYNSHYCQWTQQLCFALLSVHTTCMANTCCCEYSGETPDDGQYICPKHVLVEFFIKINLRNMHLVGFYYKNTTIMFLITVSAHNNHVSHYCQCTQQSCFSLLSVHTIIVSHYSQCTQ